MAGVRLLDNTWAPVQTQPMLGVHVPIPLGERLMLSGEYLVSQTSSGSESSAVTEQSLGVAVLLPGSTRYWKLEGGRMAYVGGGISTVNASLDLGAGSDSDETAAAFVYGGVWIHRELQVLGFEVRYTFGADVDLHGSRRNADSLQLMFVVLFEGMDL